MRGILRSLVRQSKSHVRGTSRRTQFCGSSNPAEILEDRALLAAQIVSSDAPVKTVAEGETIDIPVVYQTLNDNGGAAALQADGFNFNLHFDADVLQLVSVNEINQEDLQLSPATARPESDPLVIGDDNDASTETVLLANYVDDPNGTLGWPNTPTANGTVLYIARFTALSGFVETTINFSANETGSVVGGTGDFSFQFNPVTLQTPAGPTVSVSNAAPVTEGGLAVFTVSLNTATADAVNVVYSTEEGNGPSGALAGEDFTAVTAETLTFQPGETQKTISVQTTNDFTIEGDEEFGILLQSATGVTIRGPRGTATILDDDSGLPALTIADAPSVTEGQDASFVVSLDQASANVITVTYTTEDGNGPTGANGGSDFAEQTNTLTFQPGETQKTVTIETIDDSFSESDESFGVALSASNNARISRVLATGTIQDNDSGLPFLRIADAATVTEGGTSEFVVTLSRAADEAVTVSFSTSDGSGPTGATSGSDFEALNNQTLTFAVGETSKTISVVTTDDTESETDESFEVTLTEAIGASIDISLGLGTILDNDTAQATGNVDGDSDFDASDSFLIHLVKLSGTDAQIEQVKGSSPLTATQIRAGIDALETAGDVDGDSDFDASDSFLIHLVKLSGTNAQIDQVKGSSALTAAQIRTNVDNLAPSNGQGRKSASSAPVLQAVLSADPDDNTTELFGDSDNDASPFVLAANDADQAYDEVWTEFRSWISTL